MLKEILLFFLSFTAYSSLQSPALKNFALYIFGTTQPVHPKGDQSWVFIGGLMLRLKLQYFGHLMRRADSLEKTLMLGKIEDRRRRGKQDEMVGWHHQLKGHEFEKAPGDGEG